MFCRCLLFKKGHFLQLLPICHVNVSSSLNADGSNYSVHVCAPFTLLVFGSRLVPALCHLVIEVNFEVSATHPHFPDEETGPQRG